MMGAARHPYKEQTRRTSLTFENADVNIRTLDERIEQGKGG
jgi:hypothetical protein